MKIIIEAEKLLDLEILAREIREIHKAQKYRQKLEELKEILEDRLKELEVNGSEEEEGIIAVIEMIDEVL